LKDNRALMQGLFLMSKCPVSVNKFAVIIPRLSRGLFAYNA